MKRESIRSRIDERCLMLGDFTLSTGENSNFYFDCKKATLDGEILSYLSDMFLKEIQQLPTEPTAIGGLTMGADFISATVAMRATQIGARTVNASIVRKEPKKHGTKNYIENQLPNGTTIVVVDDVITTGKSTAKACREFLDAGYKVIGILALIDREEHDGRQSLEKEFGCPVRGLFKMSEFHKLTEAAKQHGNNNSQQFVKMV